MRTTIIFAFRVASGFVSAALTIDWAGTSYWARAAAIVALVGFVLPLQHHRIPRRAS